MKLVFFFLKYKIWPPPPPRPPYCDKVYTNLCGLNVPEDDIECESFTFISVDSLHVYDNKYYLQVYLDNCAYEIVNKFLKMWESKTRVTSCELQVQIYELRVQIYELRVQKQQNHELNSKIF